ncbi:hypothetical protein PCANC_14482 [Puccinia coronata f. sp. avenae]|uniref:Uncharacterized protein n=1 Tax=Puccinia coronata f. sp. avenae TaxID=200324 RepID=A0A2N5SLZ9_9BASI|nr:hypothetical protein PCANC_14482 [Puccinia coronata f. sp. avenae]
MSSSASMDELSPTANSDASIEFSLTNGQIFQRVIENPSRFNLSPADRLLLEEGRKSMISHTRYGFLLGATLSPLPLFRGEYALNNLRKLPPLMDRGSQRPNPAVIRGRLIWIAQSVVLTTLGSGFGTWLGFKLGLRSMERSLSTLPGCRERVMNAFSLARQELNSGAPSEDMPRHGPGHLPRRAPSRAPVNESQDHDRSFQEDEDDLSRPSSSKQLNTNSTHLSPEATQGIQEPAGSSRWEQLRRSPQSQPSTWQTIREHNFKKSSPDALPYAPDPSSPNLQSPSIHDPSQSQSQDDFEKLLERERSLSAGILPPPDRYSSTKP